MVVLSMLLVYYNVALLKILLTVPYACVVIVKMFCVQNQMWRTLPSTGSVRMHGAKGFKVRLDGAAWIYVLTLPLAPYFKF